MANLPDLPGDVDFEAVLASGLMDLRDLDAVDWSPAMDDSDDSDDNDDNDDNDNDDNDGDDDGEDEDDDDDNDDKDDERQREDSGFTQFVDLSLDDQVYWTWRGLLGRGPVAKEDAVRNVAEFLRSEELATFERLDRRGSLHGAISRAILRAVRENRVDRPSRGFVRAVIAPKKLQSLLSKAKFRALWRGLLCDVLEEQGALDRDAAMRATAERAAYIYGFMFRRLRADGNYARWTKSAINSAIRRELVVATGGMLALKVNESSSEVPTPTVRKVCVDLEPLTLASQQDLLVLQLRSADEDLYAGVLLELLMTLVLAEWSGAPPPRGAPWVGYLADGCAHYQGYSTWLGLSKSVPAPMCDRIQGLLQSLEFSVLREYARPNAAGMTPFAASSERGIELLGRDGAHVQFKELEAYSEKRDVYIRPYVFV